VSRSITIFFAAIVTTFTLLQCSVWLMDTPASSVGVWPVVTTGLTLWAMYAYVFDGHSRRNHRRRTHPSRVADTSLAVNSLNSEILETKIMVAIAISFLAPVMMASEVFSYRSGRSDLAEIHAGTLFTAMGLAVAVALAAANYMRLVGPRRLHLLERRGIKARGSVQNLVSSSSVSERVHMG